jgi:tetraspanin-11
MGSRLYCTRWVVLQANLLLMVCGLVLLALGIWTMNDKSFLEELLRNRLYMNTTYIILISSIFMILLSCFGCFAAFKEIKCFLLTYNVLMLLLFVVLMVGGTLAYVFREQVQWTMKAEMIADIRSYQPGDKENSVTRAWDLTQSQLKCCGFLTEQVEQPWQMWRYNSALNPSPPGPSQTMLPHSCCTSDSATECLGGSQYLHTGDCLVLALHYVQEHAATLGAAAIAVTALMILGMASSIALFKTIV